MTSIDDIIKQTKSIRKENGKLQNDINEIENKLKVARSILEENRKAYEKREQAEKKVQQERENYKAQIRDLEDQLDTANTKTQALNFQIEDYRRQELDLVSKGSKSSTDLAYKKALTFLELQEGYTEDELNAAVSKQTFFYSPVMYSKGDIQEKQKQIADSKEILLSRLRKSK